ncbi:MAG: hypothetical protein JXO22_13155, partial [Phycisphaerae bacterium]|nr:hypothetical protein [Phycisphaerae bacterium]
DAIHAAVTKPKLSDIVEDYVIFGIRQVTPPGSIADIMTTNSHMLAQVLRAERIALSDQEIAHALACKISFGQQDLAVVDWNAAIVIDEALDDARAVLEYANVELLEMRYLDDQLDDAVDRAHAMLAQRLQRTSFWPDPAVASLRELAEMRMESAALFENVNNALKLVGDQYLARVYQLAAERLHLNDWDTNILRKLEALESAGEKVSMLATHRRAEVLEWIIIILIAVSIGLELLALGLGH